MGASGSTWIVRSEPELIHSSVFMNLVELHKGEGMYVGADGLHAWLKGGK